MTHLEVWQLETYESEQSRNWYQWLKDAEEIAGHHLDGDEVTGGDNYSIDSAYESWEHGETPQEYVNSFQKAA